MYVCMYIHMDMLEKASKPTVDGLSRAFMCVFVCVCVY